MIVINSMISMLNRGNKIQIQRNIIQFYSFPFFSLVTILFSATTILSAVFQPIK